MRALIACLCVVLAGSLAAPAVATAQPSACADEASGSAGSAPEQTPPAFDEDTRANAPVSAGTVLVPAPLESLLRHALAEHPRIGAAKDRVAAARARARGAGALEDPLATIGYQNESLDSFTLGESEDSHVSLGFAQPLAGRGKRALRAEAAAKDADAAEPLVRLEELELRRTAVVAWWRLAYEQEVRDSLMDQKTVAELVESLARSRYGAGQGAQIDVLRAQLARMRLGERLAVSSETLASLREELRGVLLLGPEDPLPAPGALPEPDGEELDPTDAVAQSIAGSPELARLEQEASAADARASVARGDYRPDYVLGGAYMYRGSLDPMVSFSLGVRLPVHRTARLDPARDAALADASTLRGASAAQSRLLATRVRQRLAAIRAGTSSERLLREGVIPQDRQVVDTALATYRSGKGEILAVLAGLETVLMDRLERASVLLEIATQRIALETFSLEPPAAAAALMPGAVASAASSSSRTMSSPPAAPRAAPGEPGMMGGMR